MQAGWCAVFALCVGTFAPSAMAANITVSEYTIDSPVADIQWVGKDKKTVFVRTQKNGIYRSKDEGLTWEKQLWKMERAAIENSEGKSGVLSMHVSPVDSTKIFFRGVGNFHWVTEDCGDHYMPLDESFTIKEVKLHPTEDKWLMASHLSKGCHKFGQRENCSMEVYLSQDFGRKWNLMTNYVAQFDWGPKKEGITKETVFFVVYEEKNGNQPFGVWNSNAHFVRSDNLYKTHYRLISQGNRFLFLDRFLFVAVVNKVHENQVNLYVSVDHGTTFKKARLPFQLTEHSYTILDTSEGSVFLHVNHGDYHTSYGNIYISDAEGLRYSLSLRNNKRDAQGRCDFEKLQGIEGIYISNFQDNADSQNSREKARLKTKITFDKGGKWNTLKPPPATDKGKAFDCASDGDEQCSLHLHGVTDSWGPFYSTKSAIGLVMATGNVGHYLSDKEDETHTFFSRDAGLSWNMVREGSHIYEYGDHGALTLMANDRKATTEVLYSWDEAMSWESLKFSDKQIEVENIVIEPQATSQVFVLYGARGEEGVLVHMNFGSLHQENCKGIEAAGSPHSDYELWTPSDGRVGQKCLLGHQVRYTRRRRASKCFNGEKYERMEFRKNCPCSEEDYECDYGYERSTDGGPCVAIMAISTEPPKECNDVYHVSNGYRLVAGDTCDPKEGVDHLHTQFRCPGSWGGAANVSGSGWSVLMMVVVLAACLGGVTFCSKNEGLREAIFNLPSQFTSVKYKGLNTLPDSAVDDDFDLEDDDTAEELHDTDILGGYDPPPSGSTPLSALPERKADSSSVPKLNKPPGPATADLLGDGFDPRSDARNDDDPF